MGTTNSTLNGTTNPTNNFGPFTIPTNGYIPTPTNFVGTPIAQSSYGSPAYGWIPQGAFSPWSANGWTGNTAPWAGSTGFGLPTGQWFNQNTTGFNGVNAPFNAPVNAWTNPFIAGLPFGCNGHCGINVGAFNPFTASIYGSPTTTPWSGFATTPWNGFSTIPQGNGFWNSGFAGTPFATSTLTPSGWTNGFNTPFATTGWWTPNAWNNSFNNGFVNNGYSNAFNGQNVYGPSFNNTWTNSYGATPFNSTYGYGWNTLVNPFAFYGPNFTNSFNSNAWNNGFVTGYGNTFGNGYGIQAPWTGYQGLGYQNAWPVNTIQNWINTPYNTAAWTPNLFNTPFNTAFNTPFNTPFNTWAGNYGPLAGLPSWTAAWQQPGFPFGTTNTTGYGIPSLYNSGFGGIPQGVTPIGTPINTVTGQPVTATNPGYFPGNPFAAPQYANQINQAVAGCCSVGLGRDAA